MAKKPTGTAQSALFSPREELLKEASALTGGSRHETYGDPKRNMECFQELCELFNRYSDEAVKEVEVACSPGHDGAMKMVLAKLARIMVGRRNRDNYVDAAAYLAMAWECEERVGE